MGAKDSVELNVYSKLINLGFKDALCLEAAKKYPKHINKAIDFVLSQDAGNDIDDSKSNVCCQHLMQVNQLLQQVEELNLEKEYWKSKYND